MDAATGNKSRDGVCFNLNSRFWDDYVLVAGNLAVLPIEFVQFVSRAATRGLELQSAQRLAGTRFSLCGDLVRLPLKDFRLLFAVPFI